MVWFLWLMADQPSFVFWFGLVWFYGISTIVVYLMLNPIFSYILNIWFVNSFCRYTHLNDKTVLCLIIQFSIRHLFAYSLNIKEFYLTIDRTLSDATTPGQSGPWSDGNERVLRFPQNSSIAGTSPSDCLVSCWGSLNPQQRCSRCILRPQPPGGGYVI